MLHCLINNNHFYTIILFVYILFIKNIYISHFTINLNNYVITIIIVYILKIKFKITSSYFKLKDKYLLLN